MQNNKNKKRRRISGGAGGLFLLECPDEPHKRDEKPGAYDGKCNNSKTR